MKIKKFASFRSVPLIALGVFLGRGAQADTIIDFAGISGRNNDGIDQTFGDYASVSSLGVTVVGFGTPNIGLTWTGFGDSQTRWEYYNDGVWSAGQLNHSIVGSGNGITFTPNSALASVVIKSFNFHPYYDSTERFTYDVSVLSGTNVLSGPTRVTFLSDSTKAHPVTINYTGVPGQTLKLHMVRVASTLTGTEIEGFPGDIAADDITFAQLPVSALPAGPQVVAVSPGDDAFGLPAASYPYSASITNGVTTLNPSSIELKLDGALVSPPPVITSSGGLTNVSHPATTLLAGGSTHVYTLLYADNLAARYTNEVVFTVATYSTLPASYAIAPGSGVTRGFTFRFVAAPLDTTNILDSTIARAKAQLDGTLIDPSTGQPYTNSAPVLGTNADGSFNIDTVINYDDDNNSAGNFPDDTQFPGDNLGNLNWFSTEALLYLDLPAGYYRFGVNSDDGFQLNATAPQGVSGPPIQLGVFDDGRGADDTLFDFLVQKSGIYPFQLIYFENQGSASEEFFSADLASTNRFLINDINLAAIKSYRVLKPYFLSIARSGSNAVLNWAYGAPPFQVQVSTNITSPVWTDVGAPTNIRTSTVPIQPGPHFYRVSSGL